MIQACIIAEHDPWEVRLLSIYAERVGLRPVQAFTGHDVMPLAQREHALVILLERDLPGMVSSGDVLGALRADPCTQDVPVVVLAWAERLPANEKPAWATTYLWKPVSYDTFVTALAAAGVSITGSTTTGRSY